MIRAFIQCCCGTDQESEDDAFAGDQSRLIRNGSAGRLPRYGSPDAVGQNVPGAMANGLNQGQPPSEADSEQAMLQKILEQAENKSIDVSAMDNTGPTQDFTTRASKYDDIIKGKVGASGGGHGSRQSNQQQNNPAISGLGAALRPAPRCLLEDSGGHVTELLSAEPMSDENLNLVRRMTSETCQTMQEGFKVNHQEDLVVQLNPGGGTFA